MKSYGRLTAVILVIWLGLWAAADIIMLKRNSAVSSRQYQVDAERIKQSIENGGTPDEADYPAVTGIFPDDGSEDFYYTTNEYVVIKAGGRLYRLEYDDSTFNSYARAMKTVNIAMGAGALLMAGVLIYLGRNIIVPFNRISELPYELAKGGLNRPLKESRHKYFGRFLWGLDMLRQSLEQAELRRLEQAKAEKTLLLSLSHDIKTPLAAIKLYSSALSKGLYPDKEKQRETAASINAKADEIEGYVGEIIKNSSDDFLSFTADNRPFYLSEVMERLKAYYSDKLDDLAIGFEIEKYTDCLLEGDPDRLSEVLQNLMENAIKYGDGRRIAVSFGSEEDMRFITVTNSGCTLTDSELPHIFDSFWRGSNVGSRQGSGLGLYICRRLMQLMNGDIFAEIKGDEMSVTAVCKKA
ncbi:HAMP domain-containing sensor histidine kinase [Ruminococcus sp.]|uniref:sensor histidine kinase n=1 Tax=Ruminococcus sp. TaxID=41978 RepID=UPI0025E6DAB0|nr:HAMP domain-containing sensor histidine kinase [Ruminococcus sp.]MBQ8966328.1 HAMP domain-containing histidine kinase [Ruminococcus sp.]